METIIVIGGGAAGLTAAYELSKNNKRVILAEAADRLGGRIHTLSSGAFSVPVELGAEFVHGKLKHTLNLLKRAGIQYHAVKGNMYHLQHGEIRKQNHYSEHWNQLMREMKKVKIDTPFSDFLQEYFHDDKYIELRESVKRYAGGFDLADVSQASTMFLYNEWSNEDNIQYRIEGGYQKIIDYLESECRKYGCIIYKDCCVKKINWQKDEVSIITICSRYFTAKKIVITVPLSVLQANKNDLEYIQFNPGIDTYLGAANNIGFGSVIKIILEFDESFWKKVHKNIGFIFTEANVSTWWTQLPEGNHILTGWIGGTRTVSFNDKSEEQILEESLQSLSSAFAIEPHVLRNKIRVFKIISWKEVPNISGGYSYNTPQSIVAKNILNQPVEKTIYFAGEGLHEGTSPGTVEAAIISGKEVALKILQKGDIA